MNLFTKAVNGLNLTPGERAILKLLKGWLYTAIGTGLIAGSQYALGNEQIDYQKLLYVTIGAVVLSILSALDKYFTAQGDAPLDLATKAVEQQVQEILPPVIQPQHTSAPVPQVQYTPARGPVTSPGATNMPPQQFAPPPPLPGQFIPVVNPTATTTAAQPIQFPGRNWNDSQLMPTPPKG